MADDAAAGGAPIDDELRSDALDVLGDALRWRMTAARWEGIGGAVAELTAALRAGDVEAVRRAVTELELLGPVRATVMGDTPTTPVPEPVREEIDVLVRTLDGRTAPRS